MRTTACLLAVVAVAARPAFGQSAPYLAEVDADTVMLRSGPGDQMPETGSLTRNARLIVDHEEGENWLAVQPPNGQVSWINHKFLAPVEGQPDDVLPRNAVVHADPAVEIAHGRPGLGKPLDVRRTSVPDGTIVCIVGKKVEVGDTKWYPIAPPDGDFRYVPKSAVRMLKGQPSQSFVVRGPATSTPTTAALAAGGAGDTPPPAASLPAPGVPTSPAPARNDNWPNHPLWQQAERAERAGDYARAEKLYLQLASDMNRPGGDSELANLCYTRVHSVREKQRQGGRTVSAVAVADPDRRDLPQATAASSSGKWAGPGRLRESAVKFGRRAAYALVTPEGRVICYALGGGRVDLDRFVGEDVELYGAVDYPGELRGAGVMTVGSVKAAR